MNDSFAGKTIWITGGAGYLGAGITAALDAAGARTICIELPGRAQALVERLKLRNTVAVDVAPEQPQRDLWTKLLSEHGAPDGVAHLSYVSSAGKGLNDLTASDLDRTFCGAMTGTFELCRTVGTAMAERGSGSVVIFSSMYGIVVPDIHLYVAPMTPNPVDYGMSKAGLMQLSKYLAATYGPRNVRFNCVAPGPFPNPGVQAANPAFIRDLGKKTMMRRVGNAPEVVGPTLFLLSDASSYVTAQTLVVDGGWTAW